MSYNTNKLNSKFDEIKNLRYYPWIGNNYFNQKNMRIAFVAESHYYGGTDMKTLQHNKVLWENDKNTTIEVVEEESIKREYYGTKMFPNLHRTIIGNDEFDTIKLWSNLVFFNVVQRPMNYEIKERPQWKDFCDGWEVFIELNKILKPDICVIVGLESSNSFEYIMQENKLQFQPIEKQEKINQCYPRKTAVVINNHLTKLIFIKHSSTYFSWEQWNKYLYNEIPNQMDWLNRIVK